jgi:transcription antitermination protein NusB
VPGQRREPGRHDAAARKSPRRRARELALQGLYQWQLAGKDAAMIEGELAEAEDYARCDGVYCRRLLEGAIAHAPQLEERLRPHLDRAVSALSPVERGILLLGGYELLCELEVPYRVVINEAVELAKVYGGTDGHKYVNGVLDKLAAELRSLEVPGHRTPS